MGCLLPNVSFAAPSPSPTGIEASTFQNENVENFHGPKRFHRQLVVIDVSYVGALAEDAAR